ncbi:hypothetical protein EYS42_11095 [Aquabacterium lacunae]|uniref:Glycosyltransferase n=1 Tax=Aquabacterium lacunae TaxID=2528630 RepID=A0A4Q9H3G5_9BURK|nr:hypothetical protein [Aquabacterium lacunae]TBO30234.1 hypothetical protein EYS42_11095 [Aquabacterium lacunae]
MVHQRDVLPYLCALKSFARHAEPSDVAVVCDPSIDDASRALFRKHIPHIRLLEACDFQHDSHPTGGTWERLAAIAHNASRQYTVQVDADTLTLDSIPEVTDAIDAGHGFVIGEETGQRIVSLAATAAHASQWTDEHIQAFIEKRMHAHPPALSLYVRGCSGFTGFPIDPLMTEKMRDFSRRMQAIAGQRWTEWGTEQITSNYLVANAKGSAVLPFPAYCTPDSSLQHVRFAHFIGYMRFTNALYRDATTALIGQLSHQALA